MASLAKVVVFLLLVTPAGSDFAQGGESLEAMRARLLALESEASQMRKKLEVLETDGSALGFSAGDPPKAGIDGSMPEGELQTFRTIFGTLFAELAALGPDLAFELVVLSPLGVLVYMISAGHFVPRFVPKKGKSLTSSDCAGKSPQKREVKTQQYDKADKMVPNSPDENVSEPGASISHQPSHAFLKNSDSGPMWRLRALRQNHAAQVTNSNCRNDEIVCGDSKPCLAASGSNLVEPPPWRSSKVKLEDDRNAQQSSYAKHEHEEEKTENVETSNDVLACMVDEEKQVLDPELVKCQSTLVEDKDATLSQTRSNPSLRPLEVVAEDVGSSRTSEAEPAATAMSPQPMPVPARPNRSNKKKDKAVAVRAKQKLDMDSPDPWEDACVTKKTGISQYFVEVIVLMFNSVASSPGEALHPKASEDKLPKTKAQKRAAKQSDQGEVKTRRLCRWPLSAPMTLALAAMFGVCVFGRLYDASKGKDTQTLAELKAKKQEMTEQLERLKEQKRKVVRSTALAELEKFESEAQTAIEALPAEDSLSKKLEDYRTDAKNLREAVQEMPDSDFPQVEASYNQVVGHWQKMLGTAKARITGSCQKADD